jgi:hypothetical protein
VRHLTVSHLTALVGGQHDAPPGEEDGDHQANQEKGAKPATHRTCVPRSLLYCQIGISQTVPEAGFEPARPFGQWILSPSRQPVAPLGQYTPKYSKWE